MEKGQNDALKKDPPPSITPTVSKFEETIEKTGCPSPTYKIGTNKQKNK